MTAIYALFDNLDACTDTMSKAIFLCSHDKNENSVDKIWLPFMPSLPQMKDVWGGGGAHSDCVFLLYTGETRMHLDSYIIIDCSIIKPLSQPI